MENSRMRGFLLCCLNFLVLIWSPWECSGKIFAGFIRPNFTGSYMQFVDDGGVFLASQNGTFNLMFNNPTANPSYYLCIVHAASGVVVWSANRVSPIKDSDEFVLTPAGAVIQTSEGRIPWSVKASAEVDRLQLTEDGDLVMLGIRNQSVWRSFDYPTDTLLLGQRLVQGSKLISNRADSNYSEGDYEVSVTQQDLVLRWGAGPGFYKDTYWSMVGDPRAVDLRSNRAVSVAYAILEASGLNLYSNSGSILWQVPISERSLRRAVIGSAGDFRLLSFTSGRWLTDFEAVQDPCKLPVICGPLGVCLEITSGGLQCSCPSGSHTVNQTDNSSGCTVEGIPNCDSNYTVRKNSIEFMSLGEGIDYFADDFQTPLHVSTMEDCKKICLENCSCVAFFFRNDSGSCFLHEFLGTLTSNVQASQQAAYIKLIRPELHASDGVLPLPVILGLAGGFAGCIVLVGLAAFWYWIRHLIFSAKSPPPPPSPPPDSNDDEVLKSIRGLPTRFSYRDLQIATDNFASKIGSGGFGVVYVGTLPDGAKVAVKKLQNLGQGKREFYSEIATIGSIHHVNLVKLHGFCVEGSNRLLVYEFMSRGSLDRSLFGQVPLILDWNYRYNIALGTARGLAYLHHGCRDTIVHCDIKPENILLNDRYETKVSDFGLAKLLNREESQAFTTMRGTRGYLAPEWLTSSAISHKTDVYSYGMVLLEIVGGRKNCFSGESSLSSENGELFNYFPAFALSLWEQGRFSEVADPRLEGRFSVEQVRKLVKIALCCVQEDSILRPNMSKVVHMIEGNMEVEDPAMESLMYLRSYARRFNSEKGTPFVLPSLISVSTMNFDDSSESRSASGTASTSSAYLKTSMIWAERLSGPR